MGVSGSGKTSAARELVRQLGWDYIEGDDLHSEANVTKMAAGHPLDDDDRWPWLRRIADWIGGREAAGVGAVVTCSALKRAYRDLLRDGHPSVRFVHLLADEDVLTDRVTHRHGHFMPPALLRSQLDTLEPLEPDEPGIGVGTQGDPAAIADRAIAALREHEGAAAGEA
jgi:gluconokinase